MSLFANIGTTLAMLLTAASLPVDDFDPTLSNVPNDVYAEYERLRSRCPLAHTSVLGGFWTLSRHADIKKAALASDVFISSVKAVVPSQSLCMDEP